jgi:predicted transcriptional regulator
MMTEIDDLTTTAEMVKALRAAGVKQAEIARKLGVSRQCVFYHLSDKSVRKRHLVPESEIGAIRAKARERYQLAKLKVAEAMS